MAKRQSVASNELLRRAYKYIARNNTLPTRLRHQAQLQLNQFPNKSRPEMVKERCTATGRGRGILTEFGLCRVSWDCFSLIVFTARVPHVLMMFHHCVSLACLLVSVPSQGTRWRASRGEKSFLVRCCCSTSFDVRNETITIGRLMPYYFASTRTCITMHSHGYYLPSSC